MRKIVLTSTYKVEKEHEIINRLFKEGLDELHLVKSQFEKSDMYNFLRKINKDYHHQIVLYSCYDMIFRFKLRGIHIREEQTRQLLFKWFTLNPIRKKNTGNIIYTTFSSLRDMKGKNEAIQEVLLGPIFPHFTEDGGNNRFSPAKIKDGLSNTSYKVHAWGGVSIDRLPLLHRLGFSGYALQGAIWRSTDPVGAFQDFANFKNESNLG